MILKSPTVVALTAILLVSKCVLPDGEQVTIPAYYNSIEECVDAAAALREYSFVVSTKCTQWNESTGE